MQVPEIWVPLQKIGIGDGDNYFSNISAKSPSFLDRSPLNFENSKQTNYGNGNINLYSFYLLSVYWISSSWCKNCMPPQNIKFLLRFCLLTCSRARVCSCEHDWISGQTLTNSIDRSLKQFPAANRPLKATVTWRLRTLSFVYRLWVSLIGFVVSAAD